MPPGGKDRVTWTKSLQNEGNQRGTCSQYLAADGERGWFLAQCSHSSGDHGVQIQRGSQQEHHSHRPGLQGSKGMVQDLRAPFLSLQSEP